MFWHAGVAGQDSRLVEVVRGLDLYELEGLEEWWLPTIFRVMSAAMSATFLPLLAFRLHWILAALTG